jgi:hypothetical protein
MGIVRQHLLGDMTCDGHDRPVARLGFGQLRNGVMTQVVETQTSSRTLNLAEVCSTVGLAADRRGGL